MNVGHFPILVIMSVVYFTTVYTLTTPRTPYLIRYAMLLAEVFAISGIHNLGLIDPAPLCFWCFFWGGGLSMFTRSPWRCTGPHLACNILSLCPCLSDADWPLVLVIRCCAVARCTSSGMGYFVSVVTNGNLDIRCFGPVLTRFPRPYSHPTRAVWHALRGAHAY